MAVIVYAVSMAGCGSQRNARESQDDSSFAALYRDNCSGCHGVEGKLGPARPLNDPLYLAIVPAEELRTVIGNGRANTPMPPFAASQGGALTDRQIASLVNGMKTRWGRSFDFQGEPPPPYRQPSGDSDTSAGATTFRQDCAPCHHPERAGSIDNADYLALASDQGIRTMILAGRPDLGMPDWRTSNHGKALAAADVDNIVAYLSSERRPGANLQRTIFGAEGSGTGPGSKHQTTDEGNARVNSSIQGGPGQSMKKSGPRPTQ